jgi:2-polyprenyl-3-methyl-5-hydroxy-6-metoxy-1,4-benzoquinol methylase
MRDLGWDAEGIDPDPQAIQRATVNGLSIHHATLGEWATPDHRDTYDAVTLSHVIEHFHDPVGALCDVASLLRPGGRIWIATPNLESAGHRYFGRYWRALDPPRHLVLFTVRSLLLALFRAEFEQAHVRRPAAQAEWLFSASALIARRGGHLPPRAGVLQGKARVADVVALWRPEIGEEVVVTAEKPNP